MTKFRRLMLLAMGLWVAGWFQPVLADAAVVGVNLVNEPYKLPPAEQDSLLATMQSAGVRAIRASIPDDANGLAFAQRVYAHGMQIDWLVYPVTRAGTPFPARRCLVRLRGDVAAALAFRPPTPPGSRNCSPRN